MVDPLGDGREVILFDSAGVGRSTGKVPATVAGMTAHALQFLDGLCVMSCDVLGFSLAVVELAPVDLRLTRAAQRQSWFSGVRCVRPC